jgi:hypothetical protein
MLKSPSSSYNNLPSLIITIRLIKKTQQPENYILHKIINYSQLKEVLTMF